MLTIYNIHVDPIIYTKAKNNPKRKSENKEKQIPYEQWNTR